MRDNATFRDGEPYFANACVGNNGAPNYYHYAKGYSSAANLLIKQTLEEDSPYPVDTFIYPICFNMRHSVELRLKGAIESLLRIFGARKKLSPFNLESSHDIGEIWKYFRINALSSDDRVGLYVTLLDDIINDIAEIDPTGQTFRYPYNIDKKKHLTHVDNINVSILSERFEFIELILDSLEDYMQELEVESSWETHTKNLSRDQVLSLARMLPPKSTWGDPEFKKLKGTIKDKFRIGSAGFSEALKIIEKTYRTQRSGVPSPPLIHLAQPDIDCFIETWSMLHKQLRTPPTSQSKNNAIEEVLKKETVFKLHKNEITLLESRLNIEKISDLCAIYESANQNYPEQYPLLVNLNKKQNSEGFNSDANGKTRETIKILKKPDLMEKLLRFYYLVGHHETAEALVHKYDLETIFPWIKSAREEKLIADPCRKIMAHSVEIFGRGYVESKYPNYPGTSRKHRKPKTESSP